MVSRSKSRQNKPNAKASKSDGFIRIIGGIWKGKKLKVQDSQGLRPTTDRIKETLFNWLMFDVADKTVLDAFSGAGSLGFEALSRGAKSVDLVELAKPIARQLEQNITSLSISGPNPINVYNQSCLDFIANTQQNYDLVFIDPPFNQNLVEKTLQALVDSNCLTDDAFIYIETEKDWSVNSIPDTWVQLKEKTTGQVCYRLYRNQG